MSLSTLFTVALVVVILAFYTGQRKALGFRMGGGRSHSLPFYHGSWFAVCVLLPAALFLLLWSVGDGAVIKSIILADLPEPFASQSKQ